VLDLGAGSRRPSVISKERGARFRSRQIPHELQQVGKAFLQRSEHRSSLQESGSGKHEPSGRLKTDLLMVSDAEERHFRIS
jgi:hypothetical protein